MDTVPLTAASALDKSDRNHSSDLLESAGLCLLSLDGGGIRGLSALYVLRDLMKDINRARHQAGLPYAKPCQIFDLIGGSSTGG
jgi:patatin-like phospholipase/acyl hydrolase